MSDMEKNLARGEILVYKTRMPLDCYLLAAGVRSSSGLRGTCLLRGWIFTRLVRAGLG